jgi:hypothetical protein
METYDFTFKEDKQGEQTSGLAIVVVILSVVIELCNRLAV